MKDCFIKVLLSVIIVFVGFFMIFIYEPINIYASSTNDFWFGLNALFKVNIIYLLIAIFAFSILSTIVVIVGKLIKKDVVYNIYLSVLSFFLITFYIHGNYLANSLPLLDGSTVDWSKYGVQNFISILVIILVLLGHILLLVKFNKNVKKVTVSLSIAIFLMLSVGLTSTLLTNKQIYKTKGTYTVTTKNINTLSENKNYLILLVDMADSKTFDEIIKKNNKEELFKDFTYFPDTLGAYPYTRESIPYLFGGKYIKEGMPLNNWIIKSFNESKLIKHLKDESYDVNIYDSDISWDDPKSFKPDNVLNVAFELDETKFFKQEIKYILFKYLPFGLKKYSKYDTINYNDCRKEKKNNNVPFLSDNLKVYNTLDYVKLQRKNYFQFLHFDGGHYPWDLNKELEHSDNSSYDEKLESALTVIEKYIERIKESGQYDNTVIIIVADHGQNVVESSSSKGRQNPILYIKGFGEKHKEMQVSDKKVSFADFDDSIYDDLMKGKKSSNLLSNVDKNRVRYFMWYDKWDYIYEQSLDGHAWETDKLKDTGTKYAR